MRQIKVLIESDWNLKFPIRAYSHQSDLPVLIESDWNLKNALCTEAFELETSINRIRLEFKEYSSVTSRYSAVSVLIESDWNLKYDDYITSEAVVFVLIESDWNLKPIPRRGS